MPLQALNSSLSESLPLSAAHCQQIQDALQRGLELAQADAVRVHARLAGYRPLDHEEADATVTLMEAAMLLLKPADGISKLICQVCGVDRMTSGCRRPLSQCGFVGEAQALAIPCLLQASEGSTGLAQLSLTEEQGKGNVTPGQGPEQSDSASGSLVSLYPSLSISTPRGILDTRAIQNKMCIDGHLNEALTSVLATNSPDGIFNVLGEVARTAIGLCADALNLPSAPVDQFSFATVCPSAPMAASWPAPSEVALCMALDELLASWNTRAPDSHSLAIRRINARAQVERLFALPAYKSAEALRLSHEAQALEIHRLTQRLAVLEATISLSDESNDAPFTPDWAGYRQGLADGKAEAMEEAMENLNKNQGHPLPLDKCAELKDHAESLTAITPLNSSANTLTEIVKLISAMTHEGREVRFLFNHPQAASIFSTLLTALGVQEVASTGLTNPVRVGIIAHDVDNNTHYVAWTNGTPELGTELFCAGVESKEKPSRQNIRVDFLKCFANLESAAARTYYFEPIAQLLRLIDQQPACPAPKENNAPYMLALAVNKDAQTAFATNPPSIRDAFEIAERASDLTRCTDDEYANPCVQASWVTWQIRQTEITKLEQRVAALDSEAANLRTTMIAAAEEIHEHWGAHCDVEGYGPTNLMHRLERGISTGYPGYNVGQFTKLERLNAELTDELARKQSEMTVAQRQVATVFRTDSGEAFPLMLNDTLHQRWLNAGKSGYPVYASLDEFCDQSIGLLSVTHHPESVGTRITAESRAWDLPAGHYFLNAALSPARPVVAVGSLTVTVTNGVASVGIDIHPQATELADGQYPLYTTAVLLSANEPEIATRESPVKHLLLASGTFLLWQKPVAETSAALAPSKGVEI